MFVAAVIGVERLLRVDFDPTARPISFAMLAVAAVKQRLAQWHSATLPAFGRPLAVVVNYAPDLAVKFDLDATPRHVLDQAYRPSDVQMLIKGRPISTETLAKMLERRVG